jgi:hypothetical protein
MTRPTKPEVRPPAWVSSRGPTSTWRWKMLPLRTASTSSGAAGGTSKSASSIAGDNAAIAAAAAARSPPPARSRLAACEADSLTT